MAVVHLNNTIVLRRDRFTPEATYGCLLLPGWQCVTVEPPLVWSGDQDKHEPIMRPGRYEIVMGGNTIDFQRVAGGFIVEDGLVVGIENPSLPLASNVIVVGDAFMGGGPATPANSDRTHRELMRRLKQRGFSALGGIVTQAA